MIYNITYSDKADFEIREAFQWWRDNRSTEQAARWIDEIFSAINVLSERPDRFPLAPETDIFPSELRQILFGVGRSITHRIIFTILENEVQIVTVRHVSRKSFSQNDLF